MSDIWRTRVAIISGTVTILLLIVMSWFHSPSLEILPAILLFFTLVAFTNTFGVLMAGGYVSLVSMTILAAYLVMGVSGAGWAAVVGSLINGIVRYRWPEAINEPRRLSRQALVTVTMANIAMYLTSLYVASALYFELGGRAPLQEVTFDSLPRLLVLGGIYVLVNSLTGAGFMALRGRKAFMAYAKMLPSLLGVEVIPLVFAPLTALIYNHLGWFFFLIFASILVAASLITHSLDRTSRRLERRVQELSGLQAVGQALSASLKIDEVLAAVYTQVDRLMPAKDFFVALYDADKDEVSFPLAMEGGKSVKWRSRRRGNGLTETVMRQREPLLICQNVTAAMKELGIESIGREAACWLGVPIMAGSEALGVLAVQSYDLPNAYDQSHQELLMTIAAQAAVAIQNARLYARTDEALSRRLQELRSILQTTREGILLLDSGWRVLAGNPAAAELIGVAESELTGAIVESAGELSVPLARLMGYGPGELESACAALMERQIGQRQDLVVLGAERKSLERTLAPVRDYAGTVNGWLLLFRDVTEEVELARLKEELTGMLVHDLRSPLTVVIGSLGLMKRALAKDNQAQFDQLLAMAQQNSERILVMVNELLDISKLEAGQMPLNLESVILEPLIQETLSRLEPLAAEAQITLTVEMALDLPPVMMDPQLMARVFNNLIDNAIKFTPDGGEIRVWARKEMVGEAAQLCVGVSDTGPGIPPEVQGRIFEKFKQVDGSQGRRRGTGLGLPFCRLVVETHGGEICLESEVGKGSTFIVVLPLEREM